MNEIICPNCHTAFKVDEAGFASILKQVRDREFDQEIAKRLDLAEKDKQTAIALARSEADRASAQSAAAKDAEIQQLKAKLNEGDIAKQLAVTPMRLRT